MSASLPQTAIVFLELQNDFLSPNGKLTEAVKEVVDRHDLLNQANQTIKAAHAAGIPVIHTKIEFSPGYPELRENPYGALAMVKASGGFVRGTWGADMAEGLELGADDRILAKTTVCAFAGTQLETVLRNLGVSRVAFGGFLTNFCLSSTIRTAYDKGFDVVSLTDLMATISPDMHDRTVEQDFPHLSQPRTGHQFRAELTATAAA